MNKKEKVLLVKRIGFVNYSSKSFLGFKALGNHAFYPLGKLIVYKDYLLIQSIFSEEKIYYRDIETIKWRMFVGWEWGRVVIYLKNGQRVGIHYGFTGKTLYNELKYLFKKNKIRVKII